MDNLILYHLRPSQSVPADLPFQAQWQTCLRTLVFVALEDEAIWDSRDLVGCEKYTDSSLYQFLLEVICGLHSPLIAETEVLGQFREFLKKQKNETWFCQNQSLFQSLLKDVKEVRTRHLLQTGSHSYGSLSRRIVAERKAVSLWGAGQLAQEIIPWLQATELHQFSRRGVDCEMLSGSELQRLHREHEVLVIAAPLTNEEIKTLIGQLPYRLILDWRGEASLTADLPSLPGLEEYFDFNTLMSRLGDEKQNLHRKLEPAYALIAEKSLLYAYKDQVRPMGWDDLCA